jgi:hypothetical protein
MLFIFPLLNQIVVGDILYTVNQIFGVFYFTP